MYHAKQNRSVRERQIPYDFTRRWDLRTKKQMSIRERKEKQNKIKSERDVNCRRLLTIENKLRVAGGKGVGGWGNWMDIKEGM